MVKLELNADYSVRPPVVICCSRPVAKSAYNATLTWPITFRSAVHFPIPFRDSLVVIGWPYLDVHFFLTQRGQGGSGTRQAKRNSHTTNRNFLHTRWHEVSHCPTIAVLLVSSLQSPIFDQPTSEKSSNRVHQSRLWYPRLVHRQDLIRRRSRYKHCSAFTLLRSRATYEIPVWKKTVGAKYLLSLRLVEVCVFYPVHRAWCAEERTIHNK